MPEHSWEPSPYGHGELRCKYCLATNRELAAIRALNSCQHAPEPNPPYMTDLMIPPESIPDPSLPLVFSYRNHRNEITLRHVLPRSIRFGTTEWYPNPCWLLLAYDLDKEADREFALERFSAPRL